AAAVLAKLLSELAPEVLRKVRRKIRGIGAWAAEKIIPPFRRAGDLGVEPFSASVAPDCDLHAPARRRLANHAPKLRRALHSHAVVFGNYIALLQAGFRRRAVRSHIGNFHSVDRGQLHLFGLLRRDLGDSHAQPALRFAWK